MFKPLNKTFVSGIDRFLADYVKKHKKTPSQQAEYDQYVKIGELRDRPTISIKTKKYDIWEGF